MEYFQKITQFESNYYIIKNKYPDKTMKSDDQIISKIQELKIQYLGLVNKESQELCKFLSKEKLNQLCVQNDKTFRIILDEFMIYETKKRSDISKEEFISSFIINKTTDKVVIGRIGKILHKLWINCQGYFTWGLLEYFELLSVYFWLLGYDELSLYLIQNVHQPINCLIISCEIVNFNYQKYHTNEINYDSLQNLLISFKKQ